VLYTNKFEVATQITRSYTAVTKSGHEITVQAPALASAQEIFKSKMPASMILRIKDNNGKVVWRNSHLM
jgi:hypothetical protein